MSPNTTEMNLLTDDTSLTPIQKFYSGTTIFLTGATGFMGKCLLEKLLRTCPDIEKIYVLIREKKGNDISKRIEILFQDVIFSNLKEKTVKFYEKVIPISGDVGEAGLGLSLSDRSRLQKEVNIVFHVAATVNFNEKLKLAVAINVNGTKEILDLAKTMDNLKSIVHVSTAYSNCNLKVIEEKYYNHPMNYKDLSALLEKLDDDSIEQITPKILGDWPNTYTYTKAMAESLIHEEKGNLPLAVFRPGIIVSTYKEPIQGWIDNVYGPTGICVGAMMGILTNIYCSTKQKANIVPVDMVINAVIATAWDTTVQFTKLKSIYETNEIHLETCHGTDGKYLKNYVECDNSNIGTVYQSSSLYKEKETNANVDPNIFNYVSIENTITWGHYCELNHLSLHDYPMKNAVANVGVQITNNYLIHKINMILFHLLPAIFFDAVLLLLGKKPRLVKVYKQTTKFLSVIVFFYENHWDFTNDNVRKLWATMNPKDQHLFPFNMADINWIEYLGPNYLHGVRKYLCKDDDSTIEEAKRKQKWLSIAATSVKMMFQYLLISIVLYIIKNILTLIFNIF